jgi:hypothetical protein
MITISVTNSLYILPSFWASGALADIGVYRPVCIVYIPSKIQHPKFEIIPSYNLEASPVPLFERAPFVVNPNSLTASPYSYSPSATPRPHQTSAFQRVPTTLFTSQQNHVFLLQVASEGIWFLRAFGFYESKCQAMSNRPFCCSRVHHSPYLPYPDFLLALWYLAIAENHVFLLQAGAKEAVRIQKQGAIVDSRTNRLN